MISEKTDKYCLYTLHRSSSFDDFSFLQKDEIRDNVIIDCGSVNINKNHIQLFKSVHERFLLAQKSLVVIIPNKEDMERFEGVFVAVPSISEAIDYIYMEELERNF